MSKLRIKLRTLGAIKKAVDRLDTAQRNDAMIQLESWESNGEVVLIFDTEKGTMKVAEQRYYPVIDREVEA